MGTAWRRCSGVLHGAPAIPGLIGSAVIYLYLSLVHRFCAAVVRTALPLRPLLTLGFFLWRQWFIYSWLIFIVNVSALLPLYYPKI